MEDKQEQITPALIKSARASLRQRGHKRFSCVYIANPEGLSTFNLVGNINATKQILEKVNSEKLYNSPYIEIEDVNEFESFVKFMSLCRRQVVTKLSGDPKKISLDWIINDFVQLEKTTDYQCMSDEEIKNYLSCLEVLKNVKSNARTTQQQETMKKNFEFIKLFQSIDLNFAMDCYRYLKIKFYKKREKVIEYGSHGSESYSRLKWVMVRLQCYSPRFIYPNQN